MPCRLHKLHKIISHCLGTCSNLIKNTKTNCLLIMLNKEKVFKSEDNWRETRIIEYKRKPDYRKKLNNTFTFARQANKVNSGSAKVRHTVKGKIIKRCIFILIRSRVGMSRGSRGGGGRWEARYLKLQTCTVPISRRTVLHSFMFICHFQTYFHSNYAPDAYFMRNER